MENRAEIHPPKIGDEIYVPTQLHVSSGRDDVQGGLARVIRVSEDTLMNHTIHWVYVHEHPGVGYVWEHDLGYKQDELRARFGKRRAYTDPDKRPRSNEPW